jgi:outer membrane receptor protein involved in Fe transport
MIYRSWQYTLSIFLIHIGFSLSGQSPLAAYQLAGGGVKSVQVSSLPTINNPLSTLYHGSGNTLIGSTEERYFSGVSSSFIAYTYAGEHQGLTVGFHNYGISEFSLNTWTASYGRQLTDKLQIGASLKYIDLSIQEITAVNRAAINVDLAVSYQVLESLSLSLLAENLNQTDDLVSSIWSAGAQLTISDQVALHAEYQYDATDARSTFVAGATYNPIEELMIFLGVNTTFQGPAIGLQYAWKSVFIAAGVNNHFQLGQSGSLTLGVHF